MKETADDKIHVYKMIIHLKTVENLTNMKVLNKRTAEIQTAPSDSLMKGMEDQNIEPLSYREFYLIRNPVSAIHFSTYEELEK